MFGDLFDESPKSRTRHKAQGDAPSSQTIPSPRPGHGFCGLSNQGATCYLNCLLQSLYMTPEFRNGLFSLSAEELGCDKNAVENGVKARVIPVQLQRLFARLSLLNQAQSETTELTDSFGWKNNEELHQHDVQELNRILFGAIEESLYGTSGENLIKQLYHGTTVNKIRCQECGYCSEREEDFLDLTVAVSGNLGLENCLYQYYVEKERLDGKNQYRCDGCQKLVNALRGGEIRRLPAILTISLLRFSFDFVRMERYKETGRFSFPLRLDMRQYCEFGSVEDDQTVYELYSVVIHRGNAHGGHYHAFIRDLLQAGDWSEPRDDVIALPRKRADDNVNVLDLESPQNLIEAVLLKIESASLDLLCSEIVKTTGVSWNKRFKSKYGPIRNFLRKFEDKFQIFDGVVSLRNRGFNDSSNQTNGHSEFTSDSLGFRWFDFDDGGIRPIKISEIEQQFSGRESGYMLLYRKQTLPLQDCNLPDYLRLEIEKLNSEIDADRLERERVQYETNVVVYSDEHCKIVNSIIQMDDNIDTEQFILDRRKPASELYLQASILAKAGKLGKFAENFENFENLQIHLAKIIPAGLHLYHEIPNCELSLENFMSDSETRVFLWNGSDIKGHKYFIGAENEPLILGLDLGTSATQRAFSKAWSLRKVLDEFKVGGNNTIRIRKAESLPEDKPLPVADVTCSLQKLELDDYDQILVMGHGFETEEPNKIKILLENRVINGQDTYPEVNYLAHINYTIENLRTDIVRHLSLTADMTSQYRLRIDDDYMGLLAPLRLLTTLKEENIKAGARIIIEKGETPSKTQINLNFKIQSSDAVTTTKILELNVEKSWTIRKCTQEVMTSLQLSGCDWFLQMTSLLGDGDKVLSDVDQTIGCHGLQDGAVLLVRPGRLIPLGFVSLQVWLYHIIISDDGCVQSLSNHNTDVADIAPDDFMKCLDCGKVEILKSSSVSDLKQVLMTLPLLQQQVIPTPQFLRVRRIDQGCITCVLRTKNNQSLDRLKVASEMSLSVQILQEEEELGINDVLLNIKLRRPNQRAFSDTGTDLVVNLGAIDSVRKLKNAVAEHVALNEEHFVVAKHFREKYEWLPIKCASLPPVQSRKKHNKTIAKINFRAKPYFLKDGDVIGVKNLLLDESPADEFVTDDDLAGKERLKRENVEKRKLRREKKLSIGSEPENHVTEVKHRTEHSLNIHVENFRAT